MVNGLKPALELIATRVPTAIAVYLFGSMARGDATAASDVDLAYLAPRTTPKDVVWQLRGDLSLLLKRDVDLVDLRASSTVLRVKVLEDSQLLLDLEPTTRCLFEATALRAYARLNVERREILADVRERGRIVLNLQRACETSIDLAMHLVRVARLGVPQDSREAFEKS